MISALGFPMAMQFKPDGKGGWWYRKDQVGAPLPATQAERDSYVRWYGWITLSSVPLLMGLMIGLAMLIARQIPDPTNLQGALGAIPMAATVMGIAYLYLKWCSHAPARAFADRAPVGPPQTLAAAHGKATSKLTYRKLALSTVGLMVLCAFAALDDGVPASDRYWALPFAIGLPLVIGIGIALWKRRIESTVT